MLTVPLHDLVSYWRAEAMSLRTWGASGEATAIERCAAQLEEAQRDDAHVLLTLTEASTESGFSTEHLGREVRSGKRARTARVNGVRLLESNPIAGSRRVRDNNPRRPCATFDRFQATRTAMQTAAREVQNDTDRREWIKVELALVLAEATGRRLGSIRALRWEDVDWTQGTIRWRAAADKKRKEWIVPTGEALLGELRNFRRQLEAVGGWIFTSERDPALPMDRYLFSRLLEAAEQQAELPKLDGSLWHAYRRKWATERKHLSQVDVAAAGGWTGTATLMTCYQQPTNDALLAVMTEQRKVRDLAVVSGSR